MANLMPLHKKILLVTPERSAAMLTKVCKEPGYVFGLPALIAEVPERHCPFMIVLPVMVCKGVSVEAYKLRFTPSTLALEVTGHGLFESMSEKARRHYKEALDHRNATHPGADQTDIHQAFDDRRGEAASQDARRVEAVIGAVLSTLLTPVKHEEPKS